MLAWPAPTYIYPGAGIETAQLILNTSKSRLKTGYTILKSSVFLERQAKDLSYSSDLLSPMFYVKGVVSIDLVNKVKKYSKDNRFYRCPTPDGYSGIVLAGEVDTYAYSYEPLSLFGLSASSQGMNYLAGDKKSINNSDKFFNDVSNVTMHKDLASQPYSPLISLMTVDYLLTARDLKGWKGKFSTIDYKRLLTKSMEELAHGLYAENRLVRELRILSNIADYHGLTLYFEELLTNKKRYKQKTPIEGNAIGPNKVFIDCSKYKINNILEASYLISFIYKIVPKTSFKIIFKAFYNSLSYKLRSNARGDSFPGKNKWNN